MTSTETATRTITTSRELTGWLAKSPKRLGCIDTTLKLSDQQVRLHRICEGSDLVVISDRCEVTAAVKSVMAGLQVLGFFPSNLNQLCVRVEKVVRDRALEAQYDTHGYGPFSEPIGVEELDDLYRELDGMGWIAYFDPATRRVRPTRAEITPEFDRCTIKVPPRVTAAVVEIAKEQIWETFKTVLPRPILALIEKMEAVPPL